MCFSSSVSEDYFLLIFDDLFVSRNESELNNRRIENKLNLKMCLREEKFVTRKSI